jgi:hypothetical protein
MLLKAAMASTSAASARKAGVGAIGGKAGRKRFVLVGGGYVTVIARHLDKPSRLVILRSKYLYLVLLSLVACEQSDFGAFGIICL